MNGCAGLIGSAFRMPFHWFFHDEKAMQWAIGRGATIAKEAQFSAIAGLAILE
jgi:hypothetical protein